MVRVDQTVGATYWLTTMLTSVPLNLNDVTSLWLCPKVAYVVRHGAVSGADGGVIREAACRPVLFSVMTLAPLLPRVQPVTLSAEPL